MISAGAALNTMIMGEVQDERIIIGEGYVCSGQTG
jgi:hypothetical protein